jgi:hypothetical protein
MNYINNTLAYVYNFKFELYKNIKYSYFLISLKFRGGFNSQTLSRYASMNKYVKYKRFVSELLFVKL